MKHLLCKLPATTLLSACAALALLACERAPAPGERAGAATATQAMATTAVEATPPLAAPAALTAPGALSVPTLPSVAPAPASEVSLYDLKLALRDQEGRTHGLDVFRGAPVLVSMFYASCPHACPMLISDLKAVLAALDPAARARLRVLLVSFDAKKDVPKRLATLLKNAEVDAKRWRMSGASASQVRELAAVLGIQYQRLDDGSFNHSSLITLLDGEGRVAARIDGLRKPSHELVRVATELARKGAERGGR